MSKIAAAKLHVGAAETELEQMMRAITPDARSQKITVTEVMQSAFEKLREAKSSVLQLEEILSTLDE